MIGILNFDMGNIGSVANMLKRAGAASIIVDSPEQLEQCSKFILPGVGAFDSGMQKIRSSDLFPALSHKVLDEEVPVLGICLGMQLLFENSEEGRLEGLGWIPGKVKKFDFSLNKLNLKIPHMGWNTVTRQGESDIFGSPIQRERYYFVHSYHVECDEKYVIGQAEYGYKFICSVRRNNIFGMQFHPEKSHKFGLRLLKKFSELR